MWNKSNNLTIIQHTIYTTEYCKKREVDIDKNNLLLLK